MAGIDTGSGHGGKKSVNQEIPLVPFIDFLLCCVMFLLVTAVWNQLARIETRADVPGEVHADVSEPPVARRLIVRQDGYALVVGDDTRAIPRVGERFDVTTLHRTLEQLVQADPNRSDLVVEAADGIAYADVVEAMDTTVSVGLDQVSLSPIALGSAR